MGSNPIPPTNFKDIAGLVSQNGSATQIAHILKGPAMQTKHLVKRGSRYIYRCRVPFDLLHCFPSPLIWKNLKTDKEKDARIAAAAALEYRTQQLYLQLRTGMLPKELQERLVMLYLNSFATAMQAEATGQGFTALSRIHWASPEHLTNAPPHDQ
jgi:hypothetical protein